MERFYNSDMREIHKDNLDGLHKGCLKELNKGCMNRTTYSKRIKGICSGALEVLAFSLIELSIVLIIIGLLVAGVTGGKSLIDSAKSRALINELREYERAIWTFRAARDRFPGDVMNYGTFGTYSNYYNACTSTSHHPQPCYTYKKTDFAAPYDTGTFTPDYYSAPFVDLYTEGIIDFKPLGNTRTSNKNSSTKGAPNSKSINSNNVIVELTHANGPSGFSGTASDSGNHNDGLSKIGIKELIGFWYEGHNKSTGMDPKILKQIDLKMDDGLYWNGRIRVGCYGTGGDWDYTYDHAIENKTKCLILNYAL